MDQIGGLRNDKLSGLVRGAKDTIPSLALDWMILPRTDQLGNT